MNIAGKLCCVNSLKTCCWTDEMKSKEIGCLLSGAYASFLLLFSRWLQRFSGPYALLKHQRHNSWASFVSSRCDVLSLQASRTASFLARPGMKEIVKVKVVGKRATVGRPMMQAGITVICARTMSYVPVTASFQARFGRQSS